MLSRRVQPFVNIVVLWRTPKKLFLTYGLNHTLAQVPSHNICARHFDPGRSLRIHSTGPRVPVDTDIVHAYSDSESPTLSAPTPRLMNILHVSRRLLLSLAFWYIYLYMVLMSLTKWGSLDFHH